MMSGLTRREFLRGTAAAVTGFPSVIPSRVLSSRGRPGANDRLVIGCIGLDGAAAELFRLHPHAYIGALCDSDDGRIADCLSRVTHGEPFVTRDYRRVLDRGEIDAVAIATPIDRRAVPLIRACEAGKDVFIEHPACITLAEGGAVIEAAARRGRIVQVRSPERATAAGAAARAWIQSGLLGTLRRVEIWHPDLFGDPWETARPYRSVGREPYSLATTRAGDYDSIGRRCADPDGGILRVYGSYALGLVSWWLGSDGCGCGTICVRAGEEPAGRSAPDAPKRVHAEWVLKNSGLVITWVQPGHRYGIGRGMRLVGDHDTLLVAGGDGQCDTEWKAKEFRNALNGCATTSEPDLVTNWMDCIRNRCRPIAPIDDLIRAAVLPILALVSSRSGRPIRWEMGRAPLYDGNDESHFPADPVPAAGIS